MLSLHKNNDAITFSVDSNLYCESVIFKCFYWYGKNYVVSITGGNDKPFEIMLQPKNGKISDVGLEALRAKIQTDLIDFKTREIVRKETEVIRTIILAKAFSPDNEYENEPPGSISDPVGFHVADYD